MTENIPAKPTTTLTLADLASRKHHGNPKLHDVDGIIASIQRHGFVSTPTVDETSGVLVAGHGRTKALVRMKAEGLPAPMRVGVDEETGDWLVPVLFVPFADDEERDAFIIADNQLTIARGWDDEALAKMLRGFKRTDLSSMGFSRDAYDDLMKRFGGATEPTLTQDQLEGTDMGVRIYEDDAIVSAAFDHYREHGFPYPKLSRFEALQELNKLAAMPTKAMIRTTVAYQLADMFQPHRFESSAEKMRAPLTSFLDDKYLRVAIENVVKFGGTLTDSTVRASLSMVRATQACANFRPGFAAYLYRRFCPVGGTVLDTSTGYGGRLVGALASTVVKHYVGIDPSTRTHRGNLELLAWLGRDDFATLINLPAEDVRVAADETEANQLVAGRFGMVLPESCDFAFTSPPYWRKEHYADEPTQSFKRYPQAEAWQRGFLVPMMRLTYEALKPDTYAIVNIADVVIDGSRHPLGKWTIDAAEEVGFRLVDKLSFPMTRRFGAHQNEEVAEEPVYVFRKDGAS